MKDLFTRFGVILTDGQGSMKGKMFRIAHLGYYDFLDLVAVLGALEVSLLKVGQKSSWAAVFALRKTCFCVIRLN